MTTRQTIICNKRNYRVSPDVAPSPGNRLWALICLRISDETSGIQIIGAEVSVAWPGVKTLNKGNGVVVITGQPGEAFPKLDSQGYSVPLEVRAEGFIPSLIIAEIEECAEGPDAFRPLYIEVSLHRKPVVIRGRVVQKLNGASVPVPDMPVRISAVWRVAPGPDDEEDSDPYTMINLRQPLYIRQPAGTQVAAVEISSSGTDSTLTDDIESSALRLPLSSGADISADDVLLVDPEHPDLAEYLIVETLEAGVSPESPAAAKLKYATAFPHAREGIVRKVTVSPSGPANQSPVESIKGDSVLFMEEIAGIEEGTVICINNGSGIVAYHKCRLFSARSNADGFYRLPPVSRVARIELTVGEGDDEIVIEEVPDYSNTENRINIVLK